MRKAATVDDVAAWVVRRLANTAIRIPINPAESEQNAPSKKPKAVAWSLKMKRRIKG